ncbi:hypothetical protein ACIRQH_00370 [Streptomyces sp. NPDC102279]|uniref:hypothetical protein n=1 Tax=Streptomyces sp. NPDC102279 TaxID=3366153 RepID=UPI0037FD9BF8
MSLDGHTWGSADQFRTGALVPTGDGKVRIAVRDARHHACTVSLASYGGQGPTWQTSGKQVFQDFVTVAGQDSDTLDITVPRPGCFAQIDLYVGDTKHDGVSGDLPEGPDHPAFGNGLIAAWHGGTQTCEATPSTPPASTPPASSPPASTPSASSSAPTPLASVPPVSTPTSTPSSSTAEATTPAATVPGAATSSASVDGSLAHSGSSNTGPLVVGAAVLLAAGGGVFVAARRRQAAREH